MVEQTQPPKHQDSFDFHRHLSDVLDGSPYHIKSLTGGVSGAGVFLITNGSERLVIKNAGGIGSREIKAKQLIKNYLPTPPIKGSGENHFIQPLVPGETVETAVSIKGNVDPFKLFATQFARLWEETWTQELQPEGYTDKVEDTISMVLQTKIKDHLNQPVLLGNVANYMMLVNGKSVGTLETGLRNMSAVICDSQKSTVVTHGDEGAGNALIVPDGSLVYIDYETAGMRRVQEPIAKVLLYFIVTKSSDKGYELVVNHAERQIYLNVNTKLSSHVRKAIDLARKEFDAWFVSPYLRQVAAGFMMMYLFREFQHAAKRGRNHMIPHLLGMAMSFVPGIDGHHYLYPISK